MKLTAIEQKLLALLVDCRELGVPHGDIDEMVALTNAGEPGVALENLCEQLFEYDAKVSTEMVDRISDLGVAMGLREERWTRFRPTAP